MQNHVASLKNITISYIANRFSMFVQGIAKKLPDNLIDEVILAKELHEKFIKFSGHIESLVNASNRLNMIIFDEQSENNKRKIIYLGDLINFYIEHINPEPQYHIDHFDDMVVFIEKTLGDLEKAALMIERPRFSSI